MGGICSKSKTRNQAPESNKKSKLSSKPLAVESGGVTNENPSETAAMPEAVTSIQPELHVTVTTNERYNEQSDIPLQTAAMPEAVTLIQPEIQPELYTPKAERYTEQSGTEEYKRTFTAYYARLCDALCAPIAQILPELVSSEVITVHETEEILSERTSIEKAQALLNKHIFRGVSAGCPEVLEKLLFVMWHCSDHTCKALSEEICLKLNISPSRNTPRINPSKPLTHHMSSYQQYLKSKYNVLELTSPDEMLDCSSTEYVDLTLIKNKQRQRIRHVQDGDGDGVTLSEALDVEGEKKKVILIEGGPGMGKSTLAVNICKCWAERKLLQSYDAVILLPLREKEIQEAKTLGDLLLIIDDEMRKDLSKEILMNNGEKMCFICEGFDELPSHLCKSSLVANLIQQLPKCTVVYTSRPEACSVLRSVATRVIAIDGFKEESVDEYISKTFVNVENGKEMASKLKSEVKNNHWIRRILHVPINVAIVCLIFYHFSVLPDTLTQLYTLLFLRLILRHITTRTDNPTHISQLSLLNDLPPDVSEQFSQVCFVAYNGMLNGQAIFSSQDLVKMKVAEDNMSGLGLLLITPSFSVYGRGKSYSFLHLTLQEFCAAWYLSKLAPEEQVKLFNKYWPCGSFEMVWMFYSGITGLKNKEVLHTMLSSTTKLVTCDYTYTKYVDVMLSVYEAHSSEVCKVVGDYLEGSIDIMIGCDNYSKQKVIMHALGYFVMEYTGVLRQISLSNLHHQSADEGLALLIESLINRSKLLSYDQLITSNLILELPLRSDTMFNSLIELLKTYPIMELYLRNSYADKEVNISLSQLLCSSNSLNVLSIDHIDLSDISICSTNHNISLCDIRMSGCNLSPIIDKIGEMLSQCKLIVSVDFGFNRLGDEGIKKLVKYLQNIRIQYLNVSGNDITTVGIDHLRRMMTFGPSALTNIVVSRNPLRDEGVCLLLQSVTDFMECIEFVDVSMTSSSYQHVSNVLHKVKSISFTVCDDSEIIRSSIASATMLEKIELTDLRYSHHNIISGINQNNNIRTVSLSYSYSNDDSCKDVETLVKCNRSITQLKINFDNFQIVDISTFLAELIANSSTRSLNISLDCTAADTVNLLHILEGIPLRSMLEHLHLYLGLSNCSIEGDDQDVCGHVQQINSNRSIEGIANPLIVSVLIENKLYIDTPYNLFSIDYDGDICAT